MSKQVNDLGQPIGEMVVGWTQCQPPKRRRMDGRFCRLEPLDPERHGEGLFNAYSADKEGRVWTYMPYGPFRDYAEFMSLLTAHAQKADPLFFTVIDRVEERAVGIASFLRIQPAVGVIEVGHIAFSPQMQRSMLATEAMFLMMRRVFKEQGYRRYEWKCDSLNAASRVAAQRLGFRFDGVFRQATIYKGRNRDTAWYAILDGDWPALEAAFETWLDPENFDAAGRQIRRLSDLTAAVYD